MKRWKVWAGLLFCLLFVGGCTGTQERVAKEDQQTENKLQIGMSFDSFVIERWQRDRDVFVATAKEMGAEVNVQNANGSIEEQIAQIEYFIDKEMDVIVIICIDSDSLSNVVRRSKYATMRINSNASMSKTSYV